MPPLVSIGLTSFNAKDTILAALRSALDQDWPELEVLIADDASTDGSADLVEAAIAAEPRARLIRLAENGGPAVARNRILAEARGVFVCFFDDDDVSLPGRVKGQVAAITQYEAKSGAALVACYASGTRRYPNGHEVRLEAIGSKGEVPPHGEEIADYLLLYERRPDRFYGSGTPTCSLMARSETLRAAGGFDAKLRRNQDVDLAIRLGLMGGHFIGTTEELFVQYSTGGADKAPEVLLEAKQRLVEKNRAYLEAKGHYYYASHWPKLRYWHFKRRYGRFAIELAGLLLRDPIAVTSHLLATGPKRLMHERRIGRRAAP